MAHYPQEAGITKYCSTIKIVAKLSVISSVIGSLIGCNR